MSTKIRLEEYSTLGDFIGKSYDRDLPIIVKRYPKLGKSFKDGFLEKLNEVKTLEGSLFITESKKKVTLLLYGIADDLNTELNFINSYLAEAGLDTKAVSALKKDLSKDNIEGAVLKIENIQQFLNKHSDVLVAEGMDKNFPGDLTEYKNKLEQLNVSQNEFMNSLKSLTKENRDKYKELYVFIAKIADAGKLIFADDVKKDEYVIKRVIARMRARSGGKKE